MPSPLGHALGGIAAGWLIAGRPASRAGPAARCQHGRRDGVRGRVAHVLRHPTLAQSVAWFGALGMLADVDFLVGRHSHHTHSLGAVALVFVAVWALVGRRAWSVAVACAAAYATHLLLDWMGSDSAPPIGILALWPLSGQFYQSPLFAFEAIDRRYAMAGFWTRNLHAVGWELTVLLPIVLLLGWLRRRTPARNDGPATETVEP